MDTLGELGLSGLLELPEIEYWDEEQFSYVSPAEAERLPELTDVQWLVTVEPASIFDWRPTREELARRNRPVVAESQRALSVPAESEQDALELVAALERVPGIGRATAKKLGWFRRWWLRERLFGNYGGAPSGP
jgi:hypothetical protein